MPAVISQSVERRQREMLRLCLLVCERGSGGALEREKELLKQIECLTKEMTEALKATDAAKQLTVKAEAAKAKLQETLGEERSEADAVQKKLIAEIKEARGSTAEAERLRAALVTENARLLAELAKANGRISELEGELAALKSEGSGRSDAEARVVDLTKKLGVCQGQLAALQVRLHAFGEPASATWRAVPSPWPAMRLKRPSSCRRQPRAYRVLIL